MKFTTVFALIASASAINIETPKESYAAKAKNLAEGLAVVAQQQAFERAHVRNHTAAMRKAHEEQEAVQKSVREARIYALQHSFMKEWNMLIK